MLHTPVGIEPLGSLHHLLFLHLWLSESGSVDLFNETVKLICKCLMESWKNDLSCALATLEVLSALARVRVVDQSQAESKRAIRLICDFVISQCSRPAPSHSKVGFMLLVTCNTFVSNVTLKHICCRLFAV